MKNKKHFTPLFFLLFFQFATAQQGNFTATFTATTGIIKPVFITVTKPVFKFEDPHGYWFMNPNNGYKHFNIQPEQYYSDRKEETTGVAFISFNQNENDVDFYEFNDSISISLQKNKYVINPPKYDPKIGDDNKPMHIHINSITASEISFSISGTASMIRTEGYGEPVKGSISGSGHFYRQPQYPKSDILPGCNCDPTIYAAVFDDDNMVRTASACETALNHKLFDAVQESMAKIFTDVSNTDNIIVTMKPGSIDINVPLKDRPYCSSDFYHNGLTGIYAHKKLFSNEDRFGLRFNRSLSNEAMGLTPEFQSNSQIKAAKMDSLYKLAEAKKITMEQYSKSAMAILNNLASNSPDIKKLEAENHLYITVIMNPTDKTQSSLAVDANNKTIVTHKIKDAAFESYAPLFKDTDGNWVNSRQAIYLGSFSNPVRIARAESTNASYPANPNKLGVYNIIIKMEGAEDLMNKAIANIDFSVLKKLINK